MLSNGENCLLFVRLNASFFETPNGGGGYIGMNVIYVKFAVLALFERYRHADSNSLKAQLLVSEPGPNVCFFR